MRAFIFSIDALVALLVASTLLSLSFAAQKSIHQPLASRFSADLAASIQAVGALNADEVRAMYVLGARCGFVLVRDASLAPIQLVDVCGCQGNEDVATASLVTISSTAQKLLVEVHACPA
ncbi:MAG: hypothetical protein QXG98_03110 [Candidatus Micrarchaeia archaeon]